MSDVKCEECGDNLLKDELPETRAKELEIDPMFVPKICWICHVRENDFDKTQWPEEHQRLGHNTCPIFSKTYVYSALILPHLRQIPDNIGQACIP